MQKNCQEHQRRSSDVRKTLLEDLECDSKVSHSELRRSRARICREDEHGDNRTHPVIQGLGSESNRKVLTDSAAALGMVRRKGNGKQSNIRVGTLWIQEKEERGEIKYEKVKGEKNPADLMTKGVTQKVMRTHMEFIKQEFREGRAATGLKLAA